jgi:hypothetical protein
MHLHVVITTNLIVIQYLLILTNYKDMFQKPKDEVLLLGATGRAELWPLHSLVPTRKLHMTRKLCKPRGQTA